MAIGIFLFNLSSFAVLSAFIIFFLLNNDLGIFIENWHLPTIGGSITNAIFLGFAASMLGVSGFESSANFVEDQQKGVFPKTLKNMWIVVSVINPLAALFALSLFAMPLLQSEAYQNTLLIEMASHVGGNWLAILIAIDAFLVLSGAVLTSFVGVSGLLERMTLDRILPQYFLKKNKKGSSYRIIVVFLLLTISVLLITNRDVKLLAGVYTISFLSVMALFGIGNILLKVKRNSLPRPEKAGWFSILVAITAVIVALTGNIVMKHKEGVPSNVSVFLEYFIPSIVFITNKENPVPKNLVQEIDFLDREYPEISMEFIIEEGEFSPDLIKSLSKRWKIPINFMFIGSPGSHFPYKIEELGGVRLII